MSVKNIKIKIVGDYKSSMNFLNNSKHLTDTSNIREYADKALLELKEKSPNDEIRNGWSYTVEKSDTKVVLVFKNSAVEDSNYAISLSYGFIGNDGKWVNGYNFIQSAIRTIEKEVINKWKELNAK